MQTGFNLKPVKDASYLKCETCGKAFSRSWLLKNHQRIHTGERPFKCTYCDRAFSDKSNLRQHMHIHTTKEKLFQCGICDRTFAQRRYLVKHASEIHRDTQLGLLGSPPAKRKRTDEIKIVAAQKVLVDAKGDNQEGTSHKVGEHQYLTRQKTRQVSTDNKEKKYSEQDLKDFIKSNEKTMEKNGFIFIKQNFDQFDSKDKEPTLTEISEVMLTGDVNCFSGQGGAASTNNGKVVQSSPVKITLPTTTTEQKPEKIKHVVVKGRPNSVVKQEIVPIRKIKLNPADTKIGDGKIIVVGTNGQVLKSHPTPTILPQTKSVALNTGSHRPVSAQQIQTEPVTYVQFIQPTPMSLVPNNSQVQLVPVIPGVERMVTMPIQNLGQTAVLPVDMPGLKVLPPVNTSTKAKLPSTGNGMKIVPVTSTGIPIANSDLKIDVNMLPTLSTSNLTALPVTNNQPNAFSNTTPDSVVSDHDNNAKSAELNLNINNSNTTSVLENTITPVCSSAVRPLQIDEKGAVSYFMGSNNHMLASTPSVSDASWQGVLNINSEQELLELINSQSGIPTGIIGDKNVTIYIQNVDAAQGMAPLMLDTQSLPGIANFTEYSEQETIISNVSPDIPNSGDVSLGTNDEPVLNENVIVLDSSMTTVSQKSEINMNRNEVFFSSSAISDGNNLLIDSGIEDQTVKEEEFMVSVPVKDESIEEIEVKTKSSEDFDEENKFVVPQSYEHEEDVDFKNGMQQFKQETDHFEEVNESFDQDVHSPDTFLEPKMEDINEIEEDVVEQENVDRINVCKDEIEGMEESTCNELNNSTEKSYLNSDHDFYSVPVSSLENGTELEGRALNTDSYMQGDNELDIDDGMAIRNVAEEYSEQGT